MPGQDGESLGLSGRVATSQREPDRQLSARVGGECFAQSLGYPRRNKVSGDPETTGCVWGQSPTTL